VARSYEGSDNVLRVDRVECLDQWSCQNGERRPPEAEASDLREFCRHEAVLWGRKMTQWIPSAGARLVMVLVLSCASIGPTASCGEPPRRATATVANSALAAIWRAQSALRSSGKWDLPGGSATPAATASMQEASDALAFPLWQAGAVWELHASDGATSAPTIRWQIRAGRQRFFYFDVAVGDSGSMITQFEQ
jgi:hypothetical protein